MGSEMCIRDRLLHDLSELRAVKAENRFKPVNHIADIEGINRGDTLIMGGVRLQDESPAPIFCSGKRQVPCIGCLPAANEERTLVERLGIRGVEIDSADSAASISYLAIKADALSLIHI